MEKDRRALVVDDDPAVCEFVQGVLSGRGMELLALTKGAEASTRLRDEKFSLLLVDYRMPAPDGLALTRLARASGLNQRTPIIILSDDQSATAVSEGFKAGASFFLYKPVDKKRLAHLIQVLQGAIEREKRRFRRVALQANVRLACDHEELEGETVDISLDGMLVVAPRSFPAGSTMRFSLQLPREPKPISGSGVVVRTLPQNRMGIHLNLTAVENQRLHDFLLPLILEEKPEPVGAVKV